MKQRLILPMVSSICPHSIPVVPNLSLHAGDVSPGSVLNLCTVSFWSEYFLSGHNIFSIFVFDFQNSNLNSIAVHSPGMPLFISLFIIHYFCSVSYKTNHFNAAAERIGGFMELVSAHTDLNKCIWNTIFVSRRKVSKNIYITLIIKPQTIL